MWSWWWEHYHDPLAGSMVYVTLFLVCPLHRYACYTQIAPSLTAMSGLFLSTIQIQQDLASRRIGDESDNLEIVPPLTYHYICTNEHRRPWKYQTHKYQKIFGLYQLPLRACITDCNEDCRIYVSPQCLSWFELKELSGARYSLLMRQLNALRSIAGAELKHALAEVLIPYSNPLPQPIFQAIPTHTPAIFDDFCPRSSRYLILCFRNWVSSLMVKLQLCFTNQ